MFNKILVANRGEIALRIIRACKDLNIQPVAVYSDADETSLHVRLAGEAVHIGPSPSIQSYLNFEKIVDAAKKTNCEAIHPGYGFLAENPDFIQYVKDSGLIFIGPTAESVRLMGNKTSARQLMKDAGVPIVGGTTKPITSFEELLKVTNEIGFPVLLKASAGGGGKGMRVVSKPEELKSSFESASSEALKAFKDSSIYVEKYLSKPKHIEVQVISDSFGNYVHLFERECSIQRRHQKIIEEAPSPTLDETLRGKLTQAAVSAAKACKYLNAGTIEFLVDENRNFYFLEMNTRIQVEHPVTEWITGIDIVAEQIRIASGEKLSINSEKLKINGHSIEARIYAEDPYNNFSPSFGKILHYRIPTGYGVRVESGIEQGSEIPVYYDPLIAKVVVWAETREKAIRRLRRVLSEIQIVGIVTNIPVCIWVIDQPEFKNNDFDTQFMSRKYSNLKTDEWISNDLNFEILSKVIYEKTLRSNNKPSAILQTKNTSSNWLKRRSE